MIFVMVLLLSYFPQGFTRAVPFSISSASHFARHAAPLVPNIECTCPNQRSVWDIIWSCLAVLFVCSWVSVHPDIPAPGEKWWRSTIRRAEYMFWTILTPELIIYWAGRQWYGARIIANEQYENGWTKAHGHFLQMGGFMLYGEDGERRCTLSYPRFKDLLENKKIEFPKITAEEIKDRSKSDSLSKTLVLAQTGWFILQCITRAVRRLPITELELATLAFASINGCMYFFWWDKPFDVRAPMSVQLVSTVFVDPEHDSSSKMTAAIDSTPKLQTNRTQSRQLQNWSLVALKWPWTCIKAMGRRMGSMIEDEDEIEKFHRLARPQRDIGPMRAPPFYALFNTTHRPNTLLWILYAIGAGFGAIHCAGWFFHFPTAAELWIWRISSLSITAYPIIMICVFICGEIVDMIPAIRNGRSFEDFFVVGILGFGLVLYIIARLLLLIESLSSLRNLPPGAYSIVEWTSFIPHI